MKGKEMVVQSSLDGKNLFKFPLVGLDFSSTFKINFSQEPINQQNNYISGAIYTKSDDTLYAYKLIVQNSTFFDLKLSGKRKMNSTLEVDQIFSLKQKGSIKVGVYDKSS